MEKTYSYLLKKHVIINNDTKTVVILDDKGELPVETITFTQFKHRIANLDNNITDFESSRKLYEIGLPQHSCFSWMDVGAGYYCVSNKNDQVWGGGVKLYSAFLLSELMQFFLEKFSFAPNLLCDPITKEFVVSIWLGQGEKSQNPKHFTATSYSVFIAITDLVCQLYNTGFLSLKNT